MKTRNYNIIELCKSETVKASHTLRLQLESVNIGGMQFCLYVSNSHSGAFLSQSLAGSGDKSVSFGKDTILFLCAGNGGSLVRSGQVSKCGKYALRNGKIAALGSFGNYRLELLGSSADVAAKLASGELNAKDYSYKVNADGLTFHGVGCSTTEGWNVKSGGYSSLAFVTSNGKMAFIDMETKRNTYNAKVLGVALNDEDARKAGADKVRAMAGDKVPAKAVTVDAKKAAKAKAAKAKAPKK